MYNRKTDYLRMLWQPEDLYYDWEELTDDRGIDTVVGRGMSGSIAVALLGAKFGLKWAMVRKPDDTTHARYRVEGAVGKRWAFVDDFIDTGETFAGVYDSIRTHATSEFAGAYLYTLGEWLAPEEVNERVSRRYERRTDPLVDRQGTSEPESTTLRTELVRIREATREGRLTRLPQPVPMVLAPYPQIDSPW